MRKGLLLLAVLGTAACRSRTPDLILTNGRVFTADGARPWAEAVAIRGERIANVGNTAEVRALAGPQTRVIDLRGRVVVPGINDAHLHEPWGWPGERADVPETATADQLLATVAEMSKRVPRGEWIQTTLPFALSDDSRLTREALDEIAAEHPVRVTSGTGHADLFNSAGLRALGIGDHDPDPPGGRYGRRKGTLNGWLYEHAIWINGRRRENSRSDEDLIASMRRFSDRAIRFGITSVQSMPLVSMDRMLSLAAASGTPIRWRWMEFQMASVAEHPTMPMKYSFDGTPIERHAAMIQPYADRPGESGFLDYSDEQIARIVEIASRGGQPLLVHSCGDLGVERLLAAMKRVNADWPARRVRIEHGDSIAPFLDEARRLGVIVVQNPSHLMLPEIMAARVGTQRNFQALRSIVDRGVPLALGSDGPLNPWLNVMFATMHPGNPAEAIGREQAVVAYTRGSAYAEFAENEKGTIAPGRLADLAVLSQDVFTVPTAELPKTESAMTIIGGKVVWER